MSTQTAIKSLEALAHCLRAARNFEHQYVNAYLEGMNSGLDIALRAVESELKFVRLIEQAAAERTAAHQ